MSETIEATNVRPPKRRRLSFDEGDKQMLQCQVCNRSYERVDHLNRHLDSHRNERSFRCEECPAAFNRRDLLLRHQATHAKNAAEGQAGPNRVAERATKACNPCVLSKVKCDNCRPCKRCSKKGLDCTTRLVTRSNSFAPVGAENQPVTTVSLPPVDDLSNVVHEAGRRLSFLQPDDGMNNAISNAHVLLDIYNDASNQQNTGLNFFEQIMVPEPDFLGSDYLQPPPDLASWMPDVDWFGPIDIFGNDFTPTINQTFETPRSEPDPNDGSTNPQEVSGTGNGQSRNGLEAVKRRHAVFKQSAWLWYPKHKQNAFSDHETLALDERNVDFASSPHQPHSSTVSIPDRLQQPARDRIFQLVSKTARSQISIPSFPSSDCLDKLIKVGIAKRTETDAWIHPYTFDSDNSRPEFLAALVAAGCICFGIPSVSKTGLVLQEIVRVALSSLVEKDNSVMRDLQYLQASMLWLDIGAFCGYRRKMEIAESSLQALVTALRRAGRFDHVRYPLIAPDAGDDDDTLNKKWKEWVELESYKRLVYHLFEHDIDMTMVKHRQPLMSYADLILPIPASKSLWLAPSAEVWRVRYLSMGHNDNHPSLRMALQSDGAILSLHADIDAEVARSAYLHGLGAQIWEHSQQALILQDSSDPSSHLWSRARQQKLYLCLQNAGISLESAPAINCVFHQLLQMTLYVNLDDVVRFAGRCGEEAAHRAYVALQEWSQTKEARTAVSHAGQVLHAARAIPSYQNRGQDSFMIYHATMVLWAFSMMISDRARKTGANTPVNATSTTRDRSQVLYLDEPLSSNQSDVDAFILMDRGTPCLRVYRITATSPMPTSEPYEVCNLRHPAHVMKVGVRLLENTHPDVDREHGPPLIRALCGILEELGRLS